MDKNIKKYGIMALLFGVGIGVGYLAWGRKTATTTTAGMRVSGCAGCSSNGLVVVD